MPRWFGGTCLYPCVFPEDHDDAKAVEVIDVSYRNTESTSRSRGVHIIAPLKCGAAGTGNGYIHRIPTTARRHR